VTGHEYIAPHDPKLHEESTVQGKPREARSCAYAVLGLKRELCSAGNIQVEIDALLV
jgi:hypothetical protein